MGLSGARSIVCQELRKGCKNDETCGKEGPGTGDGPEWGGEGAVTGSLEVVACVRGQLAR